MVCLWGALLLLRVFPAASPPRGAPRPPPPPVLTGSLLCPSQGSAELHTQPDSRQGPLCTRHGRRRGQHTRQGGDRRRGGRPPAESKLKTPSFSQDNGSESPGTLFLGAPCGSDKPCWWGPEALPTPPLVVSAQLLSPLDRQPPPLQSPDNLRSDHCCILQARKPQVPPSHGVPFTARTEGDTHPPAGALPSGHLEQPCSSRSQVSSW